MYSNENVEHSLNVPSRCVSSLVGDKSRNRFLVGTCFLPGTYENQLNEIHLVHFHEEINELMTEAIYHHPSGEVWTMSPCLRKSDLLVTSYEKKKENAAVLYRIEIPENEEEFFNDDSKRKKMEERSRLSCPSRVISAEWKPDDIDLCVATLCRRNILLWDLNEAGNKNVSTTLSFDACSLSWDPHSVHNMACGYSRDVGIFDIRAFNSPSLVLKNIHRQPTTCLDYNPNRPHLLVSSSQDSFLKFHDIRNPSIPLRICRKGHTHWITCVKYNPYHDQLLISAGTDSVVNLWRVSSISSAPLLELQDDGVNCDYNDSGPDIRVSTYEGQESIYDVSWSACDAWCYCSVGFDGCVVLHHVPSKEKYKILL